MSMFAEVIAIGPFSRNIIKQLEYGEVYYKDTKEGAIVNMTLFGIGQGTSVSQEFAYCLGITNGWDFNQHKICNEEVDVSALREFVSRYTDYYQDAETLIVLMQNDFEFHFSPNG